MANDAPEPPWMSAWRLAEAELQRLASVGATPATDPASLAKHGMLGFGNEYAALAAEWWRRAGVAGVNADPGGQGAELALHYRRLFMPDTAPPIPGLAPASAATGRWAKAVERLTRLGEAVAIDAGRRLSDALSGRVPEATPITSLRELFELWIECGEAAWAAAAHREEFAAAQAEWLAALAELRREAAPR